jgi:endonuclease YncB( thermonuclease family)
MRMRSAAIALVLFAVSIAAHADDRDFTGVVTHVFDGDSFVVTAGSQKIEVRLQGIDAPERYQPHADVARDALIGLIRGQRVYVDVIELDRFKRKVAKVYREADCLDVIQALVRDGHAWVSRRFTNDAALIALEDDAKARAVGLWSLPQSERVPPWEFRKQNSGKREPSEDKRVRQRSQRKVAS